MENGTRRSGLAKDDEQSGFASLHGTTVDQPLWKPGQPCPVVACERATYIKDFSQFKMHWADKHEQMVPMFQCSLCGSRMKRKADVYRHLRNVHGCKGKDAFSSVSSCGFGRNQFFVDPYPLTKETLFRDCDPGFGYL